MRVGDALAARLQSGAGAVVLAFGLGIAGWFMLPMEPGLWVYVAVGLVGLGAGWRSGVWGVALALLAAGFLVVGLRAHLLQAPILEGPYYGPVMGRIVEVDRTGSGALRLTLAQVQLLNLNAVPARVRVTLGAEQGGFDRRVGAVVMTTARLLPPAAPVERGAFDFRRFAYFAQLGGLGTSQAPVLTVEPAQGDGALLRLQGHLAEHIRSVVAGDAGGFVAAVLTGDRSGLSPEADQAMRDTNLYHLVSISGLHMALLGAMVFTVFRIAFALVPPLALRIDPRKAAAALALPVCLFYLLLAGRDVATERAFIMVAVSFGAILCNRRALSIHAVALAAFIVLVLRPEALLNIGFQMSFAATLALVVAMPLWAKAVRPSALGGILGAAMASLVAGAVTAPFAAAQFGRMPVYGLIANVLVSPLMAFLVMPAGVAAPLFSLIGLDALPLTLAGWGAAVMLWLAQHIATWPAAVHVLAAPPTAALPLVALGGLVAVIWAGLLRWIGAGLLIVGILIWPFGTRPLVLVSADGAAVGGMGPQGRVFSKPRGAGFAAAVWLERDGDLASQATAAARSGFEDARFGPLWHVFGKEAVAALQDCGGADILILSHPAPRELPCDVWDPPRLQAAGGIAISSDWQITPQGGSKGRLWQ